MRGRNIIVVLIHFHITIKDSVAAITAINPTDSPNTQFSSGISSARAAANTSTPGYNSNDICLFCFLDKPLLVVFVVRLPY